MSHVTEEQLKQQIKSTLDKSVDEISPDIRYQLQMRRAQVLASETRPTTLLSWPLLGGVSAFTSIALCAVLLFAVQPQHSAQESHAVSDLDTLLFDAETNMELYEQYDFYVWLSQRNTKG